MNEDSETISVGWHIRAYGRKGIPTERDRLVFKDTLKSRAALMRAITRAIENGAEEFLVVSRGRRPQLDQEGPRNALHTS